MHAELHIRSLSLTEAFIRSFKRFPARQGFPLKLISNNGKIFKSTAKNIETTLTTQKCLGVGMDWSFNLAKSL